MKKASSAVRIGVTIPPAFCQSASRCATLGAPSWFCSGGARALRRQPRRRLLRVGPVEVRVARLGHAYRLLLPAAADHRDAELLLAHGRRELADDPAVVHDEDPVGERQDLLELERLEQDRAALVALGDEPPVHELDRADVESARRLRGDEHARVALDLARDDHLLLVAAGERARRRQRAAAADVELLDQPPRAGDDPIRVEPAPASSPAPCGTRAARGSRRSRSRARARAAGGPAGCGRCRRRAGGARSRRSRRGRSCGRGRAVGFRSPVSASISSVWPLPSTPAMPTISPARTWKVTPRTASRSRSSSTCRSSTSSSGSPGFAGGFSTRRRTSRPTISRASPSSVAPSFGRCRRASRAGAR